MILNILKGGVFLLENEMVSELAQLWKCILIIDKSFKYTNIKGSSININIKVGDFNEKLDNVVAESLKWR